MMSSHVMDSGDFGNPASGIAGPFGAPGSVGPVGRDRPLTDDGEVAAGELLDQDTGLWSRTV
ncbi:hypothetical protein [Streptomyces sp. NBC_01618]|uniref:hypothetical protein n=1 Tax=Streptomyces sp. NBC_01618 TaxID=2975900 RepID=UPI00386F6109|nr:hypothetical protein OH735_14515 [Streptomyces sp. NBC_01618]